MTATTTGKKLCWNCEGDVFLQASRCPYCGVQLSTEDQVAELEEHDDVPGPLGFDNVPEPTPVDPVSDDKAHLAPLLLLLPGVVFFLFAMALLLFSSDGYFTLRWKAGFWPLFFLPSLPLLFYGWRALDRVED